MSRTKIVATIGPVSANQKMLLELADAGMSVARLNGSHADLDWHKKTIGLIRKTLPNLPILVDIPGRKIRTTLLAHEPSFNKGNSIILTTDSSFDGVEKVPVNYASLHDDLKPGDIIKADDGTLGFTVTAVNGQDIVCRAESDGTLKSRKGINVPHVKLNIAMVTDRDGQMMEFCRKNQVDFVGISFVESAEHVNAIRELASGSMPQIVAKIENQAGMDNAVEIIEAADVIMIDRGDLSVETNLESIAIAQKHILNIATELSTPVIVATEMLHTMIENNFPTKAEVADISNAVLDGCAATMLSGETAIGSYPAEAAETMRQIAEVAEQHLQNSLDASHQNGEIFESVPEAISQAIAHICRSLSVTKIVVLTRSGFAANAVAARRPKQPIIAVSDDPAAARSFNLLPGTTGVPVEILFSKQSTDYMPKCLKYLWQENFINDEDTILVTMVSYPHTGNRMNLIETHAVKDLRETLGW